MVAFCRRGDELNHLSLHIEDNYITNKNLKVINSR